MNPHPILNQRTDKGHLWRDVLLMVTAQGQGGGGFWIDDGHWLRGQQVIVSPIMPEATTQAILHPRNAILHSNAGPRKTPWASLWAYVRRADITGEPHFQVDGVDATSLTDAFIIQGIPLNRRADCNAKANSWWRNGKRVGAVSFESQDRGSPSLPTTPWSVGQVHCIIGALTAICVVYGVACTAPTSWDDTGIGYHSQFKEWSIYVGKTCPGASRIRQMDYIRGQVAHNLIAFAAETGWKCGQGAA